MFLLDLSHTSHTRARTGIQRVARSLHRAMGQDGLPVTYDPHADAWRPLELWELANLGGHQPAARKRGAAWPLGAVLRGRTRRLIGRPSGTLPADAGVIVPEIFSPEVARALPALFAITAGPRVALFHDAIALKFPEFTPAKTVARFPAYLQELLAFDGIAAISEESRGTLLDYWRWIGARNPPPVVTIGLGVEPPTQPTGPTASTAEPLVLSVGSLEGRKNHLALLEAGERLWSEGMRFTLRLIGLAHPTTGRAALRRIEQLQRAGRPLRYDGPMPDAAVDAAYAECTFTVYPSLIEGFGLPVLESVAHGKPCVCSSRGALGEAAQGGGCLTVDPVDAEGLARAIRRLLTSTSERDALALAARGRKIPNWSEYLQQLVGWTRTLRRVT